MKKLFIIMFVAMPLMVGCAWLCPAPKEVTEFTLVVPEDTDIVDCAISPPPNREEYVKANDVKKLYLMTEAYNRQVNNIDECNIRLYGLRLWKEEQVKNYNKP